MVTQQQLEQNDSSKSLQRHLSFFCYKLSIFLPDLGYLLSVLQPEIKHLIRTFQPTTRVQALQFARNKQLERNTLAFGTSSYQRTKTRSSSTISMPSKWLMGLRQRETGHFTVSNVGTASCSELQVGQKKLKVLTACIWKFTKHKLYFNCSIL